MILKTFVKVKKGGESAAPDRQWPEHYYEADIISLSRTTTGWMFYINNDSINPKCREIEVNSDTDGFELYNNQGTLIQRYVLIA